MGSKWIILTLGDVTTWSSGGTPRKNESLFWDGDIPWISASSMNGHLYSNSKLKITEDGLKNGSRLAPKGSILLLVRGSILHQKMQVGLTTKPVAFNQDVKCLIANEEHIDAWYLLLWFKSKEKELLSVVESTGIGAGKFDTKLLLEYPIHIPPKEERENVKAFGKALFDKTELNNQTNQTLEQMAQTLFKSWFVDFDPVFDNALLKAGIPTLEPSSNEDDQQLLANFPEALRPKAKLRLNVLRSKQQQSIPKQELGNEAFPSEFEFNEQLGWIPMGWGSVQLSEFVKFLNGKSHKGLVSGMYPLYGANGIIGSVNESKFHNGIIIGRVGAYCGAIEYCTGHFWASDNTIVAIPKVGKELNPYILSLLSDLNLNQYAGGAAQPLLNQAALGRICIPNANLEIQRHFSHIIGKQLQKIVSNNIQNHSLTMLRDTLLPKLISGELQVPVAEQLVKEMA